MSRNSLWAFRYQERIKRIFEQPNYPRNHPDTTVPEYAMATFSRYEFVHRTSVENPFRTKYIAWLDSGYFRDMTRHGDQFNLPVWEIADFEFKLPPKFNSSGVLYAEIYPRNPDLDVDTIVTEDAVWLAGGLFIGSMEVMRRWTMEYMVGVEHMVETNWMGADQQALYWILNRLNPTTDIEVYVPGGKYNGWFELGYLCIGRL